MSPKNKRKLEAAINHLFSSPAAVAPIALVLETAAAPEAVATPAIPEKANGHSSADPARNVPAQFVPVQNAPAQSAPAQQRPEPSAASPSPAEEARTPAPDPASIPAAAHPEVAVPAAVGRNGKAGLQMIVFTLAEQYYGIDIDAVESIIKVQAVTRLPHVPPYNLGLTNLRGKVLPVFSLRRRFDLPDQEENKNNRIIIIRLERGEAGLLVDAVSEVGTILPENIAPAPALATSDTNHFFKGIARMDDRLVILPDIDRVIAPAA